MRLGDICSKIGSGATPRGGKEAYSTSGIPIIRSQNVLDWSFSSNGLAYLNLTTSRQKHFRMLKYIKVTFFSISPVIQSLVPVLCQVTLYLQE